MLERQRIQDALISFSNKPPKPADEYHFYAVVNKQTTTNSGQIALTLIVPWEQRMEVWRAMESIPFQCFIRMSGVQELADD
jgi:hypothetical protein